MDAAAYTPFVGYWREEEREQSESGEEEERETERE
jgi:hypothetical protein